MRNNTKQIALGGVLAAVAVTIMSLGGLIPIATYVCPMLCCMTQFIVLRFCGRRLYRKAPAGTQSGRRGECGCDFCSRMDCQNWMKYPG